MRGERKEGIGTREGGAKGCNEEIGLFVVLYIL